MEISSKLKVMKFCANKMCELHSYDDNDRHVMTLDREYGREEVRNHLYVSARPSSSVRICDTCRAAVEVVSRSG